MSFVPKSAKEDEEDEGDEEGRDLDFCAVEDVCDKLEELGVFRVASDGAAARGRGAAESVVDRLDHGVNEVFWKEGGSV